MIFYVLDIPGGLGNTWTRQRFKMEVSFSILFAKQYWFKMSKITTVSHQTKNGQKLQA